MSRRNMLAALFVLLGLVLSACGDVGRAAEVTPNASVTPVNNRPTGDNSTAIPAPLLAWEGHGEWGDEDTTRCKSLQIGADGEMTLGYCGQSLTSNPLNGAEFNAMLDRFAAFELKTPTDSLIFQGRGQLSDPAWQRAVLAWVQWTFGESWSGRACAACRTALSWHLGPENANPAQCAHLTVLDYGYAYAEVLPCKGGPAKTRSAGWLETGEWAQLDEWLYGRSALYSGDNYLAGTGSQDMTDVEGTLLEALSRSVYARLAGSTATEPGGSINGRVWHDLCAPSAAESTDGQPGPTTPLPGCVEDLSGAWRADGVKESHEPPIGGVQVMLGAGPCPSSGLAAAITVDSDLTYSFTGLSAGTYCVSIDPLQEPNLSRLVPGGWTYPTTDDGPASVTVVLATDENRFDVDFGWDYQFLPAWSMPVDSQPVQNLLSQLGHAAQSGDAARLRGLMGDTFMLAGWRSEGTAYAPAAAVEQLLTNYLGPDTALTFDANKNLSALLGGSDPLTILRADVFGVNAIYASGWGLNGQDEAILYLAPRLDGSPYWHAVLIGTGGFAAQPEPQPVPQVFETIVQYVTALSDVNVRSGPDTSFAVIGHVFEGQTAKVTGVSANGAWWRVICPDDSIGDCWVSAAPQLTQPVSLVDSQPYQDPVTNVSLSLPGSWRVADVLPGQSAIFYSYPEGKYVGGDGLLPGDTKCDLLVYPFGHTVAQEAENLRRDPANHVLSEIEFSLPSGLLAVEFRYVPPFTDESARLFTSVNDRVVALTCFGELLPFDEIATSIRGNPLQY